VKFMSNINVKAFDLTEPSEVTEFLQFLLKGTLERLGSLGPGFICYEHAPEFVAKIGWRSLRVDLTRIDKFSEALEHVIHDIIKNEYKYFQKMEIVAVSKFSVTGEQNGISVRITMESGIRPCVVIDYMGWK
jgi:hypothetical protein